MSIVTRFAPSPTGDLHIGGIRTAIFNWLFARANNGKFLLRIEDTDHDRSDKEYTKSIIDGLSWLNLNWDEEIVHQSENISCHQNIAYQLLELGLAYKCYLTSEELEKIRETNDLEELRKYREVKEELNQPHVIRFKMPLDGKFVLNDLVQNKIVLEYKQLDDFVIMRQDGSPTYLLACVVDDYHMNVNYIIRGDDHITNAFKQMAIYNALGWPLPQYAHIPLIHNSEGQKLSKRSGDVGINHYKDLGILPDAMFNYLLRLGWSHGDDEVISVDQAIEWFDLKHVGKSPSRLDINKLISINSTYIRKHSNREIELILKNTDLNLNNSQWDSLKKAIPSLKIRSNTVLDLKNMAIDFFSQDLPKYLVDVPKISSELIDFLQNWTPTSEEIDFKNDLKKLNIKLKDIAPFIRFALSGRNISPSIFEMIDCLGVELSKYRLEYALRM